ncbi:hypothetical protein HJO_08964 [Hyphomonas johnsonii MHS-2]|uniref:Lipoprotein n=1 Tax=Hyphomonas johnsonii MHS-2 TaxID=1280950 RepID=A0A059FNX1_9PROT|nr:hypothetical protein HJO_08964 [Hyphomonas johnsonii MHS-2]
MRLRLGVILLAVCFLPEFAGAENAAENAVRFSPSEGFAFRSPCRAGRFDPKSGPSASLFDGCLLRTDGTADGLDVEFERLMALADPDQNMCGSNIEASSQRGVLFDTSGVCGTPESDEIDMITFNLDRSTSCGFTQ